MKVEEITEGYKMVWGRSKKGPVRRYRCTDGSKKGRVVAKPSTCSSTVNQKRSHKLSSVRRSTGLRQTQKRKTTMSRPTFKRITRANRKARAKSRGKFKR